MVIRKFILQFSLLLIFLPPVVTPVQTGKDIRILFIGNSLTYTNDLPELVKETGKQDGRIITYHTIVKPNYSLGDHWDEGTAAEEIETGRYDFVVFQQGPSALPESQAQLQEYSARFAKACTKSKARMALYMVWPSKARLFDLDNVIYSYSNAAKKNGILLCPAGLAWKYAWEASPAIALYGPDEFHPGRDGSVLAALTIYGTIAARTDFNFLEFDECSWKNGMSKEQFLVLKNAASKALKKETGD